MDGVDPVDGLPMCMGGCPHRHTVSGVRRCSWFKDDSDAYVLAKTHAARKSRLKTPALQA